MSRTRTQGRGRPLGRPMRIGISGLGRGGRNVFRALYEDPDFDIVAVVDPSPAEALEYLLRFDTLLGRFPDEVSLGDGELYVGGRRISFVTGDAADADGQGPDWSGLDLDAVVETRSRVPHDEAALNRQIERGAGRILLCTPPAGSPDVTIVMGINDAALAPEHRIVSNASGTAHCIAPILRILDRAFGVERVFLNIVHAYTAEQRLADVPAEEPRSGRAAAENIIPQETNAAEVLADLLPEFDGRMSARALNVPVHNGSLVDLVCWHRDPVTERAINEVVRTAASTDEFRRTLEYEDDPIVSSDILGTRSSSVFDSDATMVSAERVSKTISWFDNGWAYALRAVDLLHRFAEQSAEAGR